MGNGLWNVDLDLKKKLFPQACAISLSHIHHVIMGRNSLGGPKMLAHCTIQLAFSFFFRIFSIKNFHFQLNKLFQKKI